MGKPRKRVLVPPDPATLDQPRGRGRPKKDPNQPKAQYKMSERERARRSVQAKLRNAKARVQKQQTKANNEKRKVRNLTEKAGKVEKALKGEKTRVIDQGDLNELPPAVSELVDGSPVIFRPNPGPQEEFLSAPEQDVLYGGAAGGGKSFALLADPLRYCHNPNMRGLLLRRTLDELTELIDKSNQLYTKRFPAQPFANQNQLGYFHRVRLFGSPTLTGTKT